MMPHSAAAMKRGWRTISSSGRPPCRSAGAGRGASMPARTAIATKATIACTTKLKANEVELARLEKIKADADARAKAQAQLDARLDALRPGLTIAAGGAGRSAADTEAARKAADAAAKAAAEAAKAAASDLGM